MKIYLTWVYRNFYRKQNRKKKETCFIYSEADELSNAFLILLTVQVENFNWFCKFLFEGLGDIMKLFDGSQAFASPSCGEPVQIATTIVYFLKLFSIKYSSIQKIYLNYEQFHEQ